MLPLTLRPFLYLRCSSKQLSSLKIPKLQILSSNGSKLWIRPSLFFTSSHTPSLPPAFISLVKPLARVSAAVSGRAVRVWWKRLPPDRRNRMKTSMRKYTWTLILGGVMLICAIAYGYESRVQVCPITNRRKFIALTKEQVNRISEAELKEQLLEMKKDILPNCHPINDQVAKVANKLLEGNSDLPQIYDKEWTIYFVNNDTINAFVHPTGKIFVFHGMYEKCSDDGKLNEDQLGVILGHEMAHAILDHPAEILTRTNFAETCLLIPMTLLWSLIPHSGLCSDLLLGWYVDVLMELFMENPFSRELEAEADSVGLELAAKACFDVREGAVFWGKMELLDDLGEEYHLDDEATRFIAKFKSYLESHPAHCNRQEEFFNQINDALELRRSCGCDKLVDAGKDPKEQVTMLREKLEEKRKQMKKEMKSLKVMEADRREKIKEEAVKMRKQEGIRHPTRDLDNGIRLKLPKIKQN